MCSSRALLFYCQEIVCPIALNLGRPLWLLWPKESDRTDTVWFLRLKPEKCHTFVPYSLGMFIPGTHSHAVKKPMQSVERPMWWGTEASGPRPQLSSPQTASVDLPALYVSRLGSGSSSLLSSCFRWCHMEQSRQLSFLRPGQIANLWAKEMIIVLIHWILEWFVVQW